MGIIIKRGNVYIVFWEHAFLFVIDIVFAFIFPNFCSQFYRRQCPILFF